MRFLITGITGYLGSHIARFLVDQGYQIAGLIRESSKLNRLDDYVHKIDLITYKNLEDLKTISLDAEDIICHFATCYGRNQESLSETIEANYLMPIYLLQLATKKKGISFCNCSTSLPRFVNPYSLSKAQFSEWGQYLSEVSNVVFVDLIMEHFYGPNDDNSKFISNLISKLKNNDSMLMDLTPGEQIRDFIYIDDAVSAIVTILNAIQKNELVSNYMKIPVGSGVGTSIRQIVEKIHQKLNSSVGLNFSALPYRKIEAMYSVADISLLKSFGWQPEFGIDDGIAKIINGRKT
jgi:nucleoside-diphosphate-sugar epimerase